MCFGFCCFCGFQLVCNEFLGCIGEWFCLKMFVFGVVGCGGGRSFISVWRFHMSFMLRGCVASGSC